MSITSNYCKIKSNGFTFIALIHRVLRDLLCAFTVIFTVMLSVALLLIMVIVGCWGAL